jgi:hypothetical protein
MLISVHLPKTAGSSFLAAIEQHFAGRLLRDYEGRPITRSGLSRNSRALLGWARYGVSSRGLTGYDCVHGHFMPLKYRQLSASATPQFVTWMRHPVDRLASHYYHWMRVAPPAHASPVRRRVYQEQWTLQRFCLGREFRNIYSNYLWGFPLSRFDFIGITEHYDTELDYFSRAFMDGELTVMRENANPARQEATYIDDPGLREKIEHWHGADLALYRQALAMRQRRLQAFD